jgi:hypothetical protein
MHCTHIGCDSRLNGLLGRYKWRSIGLRKALHQWFAYASLIADTVMEYCNTPSITLAKIPTVPPVAFIFTLWIDITLAR